MTYDSVVEAKELWAEALRAYLTSPSYMKAVAPNAALLIRRLWNADPRLNKFIQFNTLAPAALGGGLLSSELAEREERRNRGEP